MKSEQQKQRLEKALAEHLGERNTKIQMILNSIEGEEGEEDFDNLAVVSEHSMVPKDWVDGKEMTVEDWGQREYDSGYKVGVNNGLEQAAAQVMGIALNLFTQGYDGEAGKWRKVAEDLKAKSKAKSTTVCLPGQAENEGQ
jgi:hypothetical protein